MASDEKKPHGRPTLYTEEIEREVLERLSAGEALKQICRDDHMPHEATVRKWAREDVPEGFYTRYTRARNLGLDSMADETLDIAHDGSNDWMEREDEKGRVQISLNGEHVQRSRLRVDTMKWYLSKMAPKRYGERVELTGRDGGPIDFRDVTTGDLVDRLNALIESRGAAAHTGGAAPEDPVGSPAGTADDGAGD